MVLLILDNLASKANLIPDYYLISRPAVESGMPQTPRATPSAAKSHAK
jgi:hypothetical protein